MQQPVRPSGRGRRGLRSVAPWFLLTGAAVAFADSSIVVLALPDLLRQFDVSITTVAWTVTAYNVALAVVAYTLARLAPHRLPAVPVARAGVLLFFAASIACGVAPGIVTLIVFRALQGAGAACLLVGALPVLRASTGAAARANSLWIGASVFGAALGPAAGGFLTEVFSWRAIFFAQAPIAALAFAGTLHRYAPEPAIPALHTRPRAQTLRAALSLAFASAALVGLLFLSVILLIDVWRFSPLVAAAIVSVIPVATLVAQRFAARNHQGVSAAGGLLLAGGLLAMALLPSRSVVWVVAGLVLAGIGVGLLLPRLTRGVLGGYGSPVEAAARTIWIRHAGLVVGLLVLTPLLAADLSTAGTTAKLRGISVVLDAPVPASTKLRLAVDLVPILSRPTRQGLPDFAKTLEPKHDRDLAAMGQELNHVVQATVTRAFRRTFLVAALLGLLAVAPGIALRRLNLFPQRSRLLLPGLAALVVAGLATAEIATGAASFGERPRLLPPCAERPPPSGADGKTQQVVLKAIDVIACQLHESREALIANLAKSGRGEAKIVAELAGGSLGNLGGLAGLLKDLVGARHP